MKNKFSIFSTACDEPSRSGGATIKVAGHFMPSSPFKQNVKKIGFAQPIFNLVRMKGERAFKK